MKAHIMKDPVDLDPFSERQIELTRILDAGGESKIQQLIHFSLDMIKAADTILMSSGMSLDQWQRATYEAAQMARAGDHRKKFVADCLWILVQYLQASYLATNIAATSTAFKAALEERHVPIPERHEE